MLVDMFKEVDGGGYEFFQYLTKQNPALLDPMQLGTWISSYIGVGLALLLAVLLYVLHGRTRAAQVSLAAFLFAVVLVEVLRHLVGARRPGNAEAFVDADEMTRSFPARGVFLFSLCGVLLLFAAWGALSSTWKRVLVSANIVALILGVAFSQLVLQLHYVTDVIGGLFGGLALALLATRFFAYEREALATERPIRR